jgi:uncharacterized membrane protein
MKKIVSILIICISVFGLCFPFLRDGYFFVDSIPWVFGFMFYPLIILMLAVYENIFSPPWFNLVVTPIIFIYYLWLLISAIGLLTHKRWGYSFIIVFLTLNFFIGVLLLIISKFFLWIPFYVIFYSILFAIFYKKFGKQNSETNSGQNSRDTVSNSHK